MKMSNKVSKLKKCRMKEPSFEKGYDALEEEFALASMLIEARTKAKLSEGELAQKMGTSQSTIARLERAARRSRAKHARTLRQSFGNSGARFFRAN